MSQNRDFNGKFAAAAPPELVRRAVISAVQIVAREESIEVDAVLAPRGRRCRRARHVAAYMAVVAANLPVRQVAQEIAVSDRALGRNLAGVEDRRDDRQFDRRLARMERQLNRRIAG